MKENPKTFRNIGEIRAYYAITPNGSPWTMALRAALSDTTHAIVAKASREAASKAQNAASKKK